MIGVTTSPTHISMFRKFNVWYSVQNGLFSDPNTWESNGKKRGVSYPQNGDEVYISHMVGLDVGSLVSPLTLRNLYVSGTLYYAQTIQYGYLIINGNLQVTGTLDQTGTSSRSSYIWLNGIDNTVVNYVGNNYSYIVYSGAEQQSIMPLNYYNLQLGYLGVGSPVKNLMANLVVNNFLGLSTILNANGYNISVLGATGQNIGVNGQAARQSYIYNPANILFGDFVVFGGGNSLSIIGNANIEVRNGLSANALPWDWSTSNVTFTTNNQTILTNSATITCYNATIAAGITLTTSSASTSSFIIAGTINGVSSSSTLNNSGNLQFTNTNLQMTTGIFNYRYTSNSTIVYNFNGNYTLPFATYENLQILGTGIKYAPANMQVNYVLYLSGRLELSTYNIQINGQTSLQGGGVNGGLTKSGAGSIIFVGPLIGMGGTQGSDFSVGNPTIEFRGGLTFGNIVINLGSGNISFTTNNQILDFSNTNQILSNNITIANGITVSQTALAGIFVTFNGIVNGAGSTAKFQCNQMIVYNNAQQPMQTGILDCNNTVNTFTYGALGNQDITAGTYRNLTLNGSGAKRLLGNVSVINTYTLSSPATLNANGFNLTNP